MPAPRWQPLRFLWENDSWLKMGENTSEEKLAYRLWCLPNFTVHTYKRTNGLTDWIRTWDSYLWPSSILWKQQIKVFLPLSLDGCWLFCSLIPSLLPHCFTPPTLFNLPSIFAPIHLSRLFCLFFPPVAWANCYITLALKPLCVGSTADRHWV